MVNQMARRTVKSPTTGKIIEAEIVDVIECFDPPTRMVLSDGSELRIKLDVIEVVRVDGEWDSEGHPIYVVRSGKVLAVLESPDHLKKPATKDSE